MDKLDFFKKYWQYFVYFIVVVTLFHNFIFSDSVLFSSDQLESGVFFRKMYADFVKQFYEMPLWDRFISGGLPFVDATHGDTFYPTSVLKFFIPLHRALGYKLVIHVFLAGVFMYGFLQSFGLKKLSAFCGGLAYMLAPMLVSLVYPGHDAKMYVAALLPLAFNFLSKGLKSNKFRYFIYFGITVGFMILSSHVQTAYFALWSIFFYAVYSWIMKYKKEKNIALIGKSFAMFWAGCFLALMISAVQLIPPYLYAKEFSIRGTESKTSFEHACSWGMHPEEVFSLVSPEFCGENRMSHVKTYEEQQKTLKEGGSSYWGRNAFKLNSEYSGVVILTLSILALFFYRGKRRKEIYFFNGVGVFVILYSLVNHTPLFYLAYKIIPGVNLFRGQGMILFILTFVLSVAGSMFIDNLLEKRKEEEIDKKLASKVLITAFVIIALILLNLFLFPSLMSLYQTIFDPSKMPAAEYLPIIKKGFTITGIFILLTIGAIYLKLTGKLKGEYLVAILALLIVVDCYRIDQKFVKTVSKDSLGISFKEDNLIREIKKQYAAGDLFRVLDLDVYGLNKLPIHGVETVRGFHDNELKWYRKFRGINEQGVNTDRNLLYNLRTGTESNFLNIVGTKYIFTKGKDGKPNVIPNSNYMPRAYTVSNFEVITDEDAIVERMKQENFDYKNTVILEQSPAVMPAKGEGVSGSVKKYRYDGNELNVEVSMKRAGILFMSDTYFPYWHAYDESGKELEILKANLAFRAISLPAGEHKINFKFVSTPYNIGKYLSVFGLLLGFSAILLGVLRRKKR